MQILKDTNGGWSIIITDSQPGTKSQLLLHPQMENITSQQYLGTLAFSMKERLCKAVCIYEYLSSNFLKPILANAFLRTN